jgi:pilus assembly protein Flp/PilA
MKDDWFSAENFKRDLTGLFNYWSDFRLRLCFLLADLQGLRCRNALARHNQRGAAMGILVTRFFRDESAATAIEYGLIAAGISIAIIAAVAALGTSLNTTFTSVSTALK